MQHSLAQRLVAALVEEPTKAPNAPVPDVRPTDSLFAQVEPGGDSHADQLAAKHPEVLHQASVATTPESVNEGIVAELQYIGLLDADDDVRLRIRDCEDDGLCIQIRAWQEALRVVTLGNDSARKLLFDTVKPKLAKLQRDRVKQEMEARLIEKYKSMLPPSPKPPAKSSGNNKKDK